MTAVVGLPVEFGFPAIPAPQKTYQPVKSNAARMLEAQWTSTTV
jgi:hypothetical protein